MTGIAIHGTGRMAAAITAAATVRDDVSITALVGPQAPEFETDIPWISSLGELPGLPDLLIDFTLPEGTRAAAAWCGSNRVPLLSGVTGLPADVIEELRSTANSVPVLWSPNLSLGVNLLADLAGRAAAIVNKASPVMIEDIHHRWKKDAPSGTALMLGGRIAQGRDGDGSAIEYRSVREGEAIGEHTITFRLNGEEFDLVHRAHDRSIFARGALDAGTWLTGQAAGLYSARDWLSALVQYEG
jgi:4-hydroxy-tetrahydrodipicolinate reductase